MIEVKIFMDEYDMYKDKPMHDYLLLHLMHNNIMGATVFEAIGGFGHKHHLHLSKKIGNVDDRPIMIMFIDEEDKVKTVLPHLREVINEGLIVVTKVETF